MYPTDKEAYIHICEGYDTIEVNGQVGFGVSRIPENANENFEIWVAGDMDSEMLITTIAHEYKHFMQCCNGDTFNEDEAEKFANKIFEELTVRRKDVFEE